MKAVRHETARIIRGNNRRYTAAVVFSFLSCRVPESIKIHAPNTQAGSVPDQIVYPYLSHIEKRFFSGKEIRSHVFPNPENKHKDGRLHAVQKRPYSRIGYVGVKADADGNVTDTITLYMPSIELKKITLKTNPDRIIKKALITVKTKTGLFLTQYRIENNHADTLVFDLPAKDAAILELHITQHTPHKRIWILAFYPGFEFPITEKDIISIKTKKKKQKTKKDQSDGFISAQSILPSIISRASMIIKIPKVRLQVFLIPMPFARLGFCSNSPMAISLLGLISAHFLL